MIKSERKFLERLINKYSKNNSKIENYSLTNFPFEKNDIINGAETLIKGKVTMSEVTLRFEKEFAKFLGSKNKSNFNCTCFGKLN